MWIHEDKNWPNFTWDEKSLATQLAEVRHRQGLLLGRMKGLGFELKNEAFLTTLTNDVVKSSAIEGENLNPEEVRSSIARKLGIETAGMIPSGRNVEGIVEIMLDATQNYSHALSKERLFGWHAALFPTGRSGMYKITVGDWRKDENGPMQVVSGPMGKAKVHFEAPSAERLEKETHAFLQWFAHCTNIDLVLAAGIAHFWFVSIHPFDDGNGRIARAIGDMALARSDGTQDRFYSLSSQIELERKEYYLQLEKQQRSGTDITNWLKWYLLCLDKAIQSSDVTLAHILLKAELWHDINQKNINDRQRIVINRMLEVQFKGYITTSKYAHIAKCSKDTALRDIQDLKQKNIFIQNPGGGRSTSYRLHSKDD